MSDERPDRSRPDGSRPDPGEDVELDRETAYADKLPESREIEHTGADIGDPIPNPGLPEHLLRLSDADPEAGKRAERQVATMFGLATVLLLAFCVLYFVVPEYGTIFGYGAMNVALGGTLGAAMLLMGAAAIHWAKKLMGDHEIVEYRHPASSTDEDKEEALEQFWQGAEESGFGRRKLIRNSLLGALGALGLPAIVLLRDLGPLPGDTLEHTVWRKGMRIVNDVTGEPINIADIQIGQLVNAEPEVFFERKPDGVLKFEGSKLNDAKAKAAVIVVRMPPEDVHPLKSRRDWGVDGVLCYSKICTHIGCPISLWEQHTYHLLCPCHQSTFDLANNGRVLFGPAARSLPQLPIHVDSEGYLLATSDFHEPVGPSFWERG